MKKLMIKTALAAPLSALMLSTAASAQMFDDLIVFGDSLSDPGNIPLVTGGLDIPPAPYFENQFSSGQVYTYLLDDLLGFSAARSSNFAVGGARTGPAVTQSGFGLDNGNALLAGTGTQAQVNNFLSSGRQITEKDLFILYAGGNDYLALNPAVDNPINVIGNAVGNIATQVQQLTGAGARQIIVPLLPDLGLTAQSVAGGPAAQAAGTGISDAHNGALVDALGTITGVTGAQIYVVDSTSFLRDVVANPSKYGFSNVTDACFTGVSLCADPESFLFFDGIHPSGRAQQATAAFFADTILGTRTPAAHGEVASQGAIDYNRSLTQYARSVDGAAKALFTDIRYTDGDRDTEAYTLGYDYQGFTATIGGAKDVGGAKLGATAAYSTGEIDYQLGKGQTDFDTWRLGGFALVGSGRLTGTVAGHYSFDTFDQSRVTGVANQTADAEIEGNTFSASAEVKYALVGHDADSTFKLSPLVRLNFVDGDLDSYTETGAVGLNRIVSKRDFNPGMTELGAEFEGDYGRIYWSLEGVYSMSLGSDKQTFSTALASLSSVPVNITTSSTDNTFGRISGTVGFGLTEEIFANVGGTVAVGRDDGQDYGLSLSLGRKF